MQAKEKIDSIKLISERLALLTQPTIDDTINGKQEYLESMIREQQEHQSTKLAPITGPYQPELYQAAKEISESLENTHVSPSSPVGKMIEKTQNLAEIMSQLSSHAGKGDKQGILTSSKDIVSIVGKIKEDTKSVINNCKDQRIKNEVINFSIAIENYATQLKILCAVKASSTEPDPEAEEQLTRCAQNLAKAIQNCIKYSEIAQLKK